MDNNIITLTEQIVNWIVVIDDTTDLTGIPDGIYPFNDLIDQWVVIINEQAVNWAETWGKAFEQYAEALRVKREHAQRNPGELMFEGEPLEFDGDELIFTPGIEWPDDYGLGAALLKAAGFTPRSCRKLK